VRTARCRLSAIAAAAALLVACTAATPEAIDPTASSPIPSSSDPGAPPAEPTLAVDPDPGGTPSAPVTEPEDWRQIVLPPKPRAGHAVALANGWDGGFVAVTQQAAGPQENDQHELVLWNLTGDGAIDRAFGVEVPVRIATSHGHAPLEVEGIRKRALDDSLLIFTTAVDSGEEGPGIVHRIDRTGEVDRAFRRAQNGGFVVGSNSEPRMAVVADGDVRICFTHFDRTERLGIWALRADGSRDDSFAPDGIRLRAVPGDYSCGGIDSGHDRDIVLSAMHHVRNPRDENLERREIELVRMTTAGDRDATFGSQRLSDPARSFEVQHLRVARDGSIYVGGLVAPVSPERQLGGPEQYERTGPARYFVAKADADGRWIRSFGDDGVATFDTGERSPRMTSLDPAGDRVLFTDVRDVPGDGSRVQGSVRLIRAQDGTPDPVLGHGGSLPVDGSLVRALVDGTGRLVWFGTRLFRDGQRRGVLQRYQVVRA
jgi:hypothetical protein